MSEMQRNYYKVTLCHNEWADDERTGWLALSEDNIQMLQSFLDRQRQIFIAKYPEDAEDVELWSEWLHDAFVAEASDFTVNVGRIDPAYLVGIDMSSCCATPPADAIVFNP